MIGFGWLECDLPTELGFEEFRGGATRKIESLDLRFSIEVAGADVTDRACSCFRWSRAGSLSVAESFPGEIFTSGYVAVVVPLV